MAAKVAAGSKSHVAYETVITARWTFGDMCADSHTELPVTGCVYMDFSVPAVTPILVLIIFSGFGVYMHTEKPGYPYPCMHDKH